MVKSESDPARPFSDAVRLSIAFLVDREVNRFVQNLHDNHWSYTVAGSKLRYLGPDHPDAWVAVQSPDR